MLDQINSQLLIPMLEIQLETNAVSYSKEQIVGLIEKLFRYGKHVGVDRDTYNKGNLLVRKGDSKSKTISWMQIQLVDTEKLQRKILSANLMFYCDKHIYESDWFVSYFHPGEWVDELKKVVSEFEEKCFKQ